MRMGEERVSEQEHSSGSKPSLKTGCVHASMICLLEAFAMVMAPFRKDKRRNTVSRLTNRLAD
jgi:hypothetical protein